MSNVPDFSNIEKLKVSEDATALYTFYRLEGAPVLEARPAHEVNPKYMDRALKKGKKVVQALKGDVTCKKVQEAREQDYELYPRFVVVGWPTPPVDNSGNKVPFSKANCEAFLRALRFDIFNEFRDWCTELDNFVKEDDLDSESLEDLAKN